MVGALNFNVMPVLFKPISEDMDISATDLGSAIGVQGFTHVTAVFFFGFVADMSSSRLRVLAVCMVFWSLGTLATAHSRGLRELFVSRAIVGFASGVCGPLSQCLIADWTGPSGRGRAFSGVVIFTSVGQVLASSGAERLCAALDSWRSALVVVGVVTLLYAAITFLGGADERDRTHQPRNILTQLSVLRNGTLLIVILQGFFASTGVQAMSFMDLWLEHCGFSDDEAADLYSASFTGGLVGCALSGLVSDFLDSRHPDYGRIVSAQFGDAARIPAVFALLAIAPTGNVGQTCVLCFLMGITNTWSYVGAVKPMCVDAVDEAQVGTAIAIAATVDGAVASVAGAPLVGWVAQHVFSFQPGVFNHQSLEALQNAFGSALLATSVGMLVAFSLLCLVYPSDRRRALRRKVALNDEEGVSQLHLLPSNVS